jgi:hypothetical protein
MVPSTQWTPQQVAFETAAKAAYRQSLPQAGAQILEPL